MFLFIPSEDMMRCMYDQTEGCIEDGCFVGYKKSKAADAVIDPSTSLKSIPSLNQSSE